ncbi:hypothetical protein HJC23_006801 [Cyclotella cryptica]|uniref:USP domain-containing protein n=1 Tax=Cyclotella cryptica TaxID=29204 RepID=A0ABD3PFP4_9STRA
MIADDNDNRRSSMEVEETCTPPPSDRFLLNSHETKAAGVVSEGEGSSLSESGDDLFPTPDQEKPEAIVWPANPNDAPPQHPAIPTTTDIVPFDQASSSLSDFYANRPTNDEADEPPALEEPAPITIRTKRKRATGLGNLGNTCFMNSTLQCLAHTAPLREYFLSGEFKHDLNKDNPLGTGGELATEFAQLLHQMWSIVTTHDKPSGNDTGVLSTSRVYSPGNYDSSLSSVTYPRSFKHTLGKYAEQFVGYEQHDSQELAIYLLDALHEDTNRVTKKPYIEKPEQEEDESDEVAAEKAWRVHLQREDSRVFEYFMGQIKSRLQCTTKGCGRVSTTFDPSMYLSVPIPGSMDREMKVTFVPLDRSRTCAQLTVKLCKNSTIMGLRKHVADVARECYGFKEGELVEEDIQFVDVFQDKVYTFYADDHHIDKIRDSDETYAYQLFPLATVKKEFATYQEEQKKSAIHASSENDEDPSDFLLDYESRIKLDDDDEWQKSLERYIPNPHLSLVRLLNGKRSSLKERSDFYDKIMRFVTKCRKCPDCKLVDDVIMEEKSDKAEPFSSLNPNEATDSSDALNVLAEVCEMSHSFRNVNSARDVAILEYCAFKFKGFMNQVEQASKALDLSENGFIVDIALHKNGKRVGKPIVVRIPSTLTVSELRNSLANQLTHVLKADDEVNGRSAREAIFGGMSTQSSIMRQVAFSQEPRNKYGSSRPESFGSVTEQHLIDGTPSFAKPSEDEEKQLVANYIADQDSTIVLRVPSHLNYMVDEDVLSVSEAYLTEAQKIEKAKLQDNKVSVMDCIAKFCQAEQLDENDMWYCNKCKQHNQAWKECHLYRTPRILVIHLKRFHYSSTTHRRDKIDTLIDFPLNNLDLREFVTHWEEGEEPIYDCYAVSNHFGGLGGGHYTAYARGDDGSWSNFDDSRVTPGVSESEVVSSAAYCLYYRRKDVVFNTDKAVDELSRDVGSEEEGVLVRPPKFDTAHLLTDDASSQANMDVDDRSTSLSISSAAIDKNWAEDTMNDDDDIPSQLIIGDGRDDSYPLQ